MLSNPYNCDHYRIQRQTWRFSGKSYQIYTPASEIAFYVERRMTMRGEYSIYADEKKSIELLRIDTKRVGNSLAGSIVTDIGSGQKIGTFRYSGIDLMAKNKWTLLDSYDNEIGVMDEVIDNMSLISRILSSNSPKQYKCAVGGNLVFVFNELPNVFGFTMDMDYTVDNQKVLDRKLGIAAAAVITGWIDNRRY